MLVEHAGGRYYLFTALEATPLVLAALLRDTSEAEADSRPDPVRFTVREVVAHLADWEEIFLSRLTRTRDEHEPSIDDIEEGQRVVERDYAHSDLREQLAWFGQHRTRTVAFLRALDEAQWQRCCRHPRLGRSTLECLATLIPLHDAYHLRQIVEWREGHAKRELHLNLPQSG